MHIGRHYEGWFISIVVRPETSARLQGTCFRPGDEARAGNFIHWRGAIGIFVTNSICDEFAKKVLIHSVDGPGTYSITIDCHAPIGWSGTDDVEEYHADDLEPHKPNRNSSVLRVIRDRHHLLAPLTSLITFVYELKWESGGPVAVIHSIYPGPDIGPLDGDLTTTRNIVMFDFNHPGEQ